MAKRKKEEKIMGNFFDMYDYTERDNRVAIVTRLQTYAKDAKQEIEQNWKEYDNYYNGKHTEAERLAENWINAGNGQGISFVPAITQEPYIQVESMITPEVPDFEFTGRDDDLDSEKAKQREYVVKYILQNNNIDHKNLRNERRLGKYGNSFMKVYWDSELSYGGGAAYGDIMIKDVDPANLFPDPDSENIQDGQYINYTYPMHINVAMQRFKKALDEQDLTVSDIMGIVDDADIYANSRDNYNEYSVRVIEHWFKQPYDGEAPFEWTDDDGVKHNKVEFKAGDIACSIIMNGKEVKYIPLYWIRTSSQNKLFPFVHFYKIADTNSLWGISEMEHIIAYVDAIDRELSFAQINRAYMAADLIVCEEDALAEDEEMSNAPGSVVYVKNGRAGAINRLGGMNTATQAFNNNEWYLEQISKTTSNFDSNRGKEPARVTTASGIAMLNERSDKQKSIKGADRLNAFERLFELIDWSALEFYDDDRMIFIGASKEQKQQMGEVPAMVAGEMNLDIKKGSIYYKFNSNRVKKLKRPEDVTFALDENGMSILDEYGNPQIESMSNAEYYYPKVDMSISAGEGIAKSKPYTLSVLEALSNKPIDPSNVDIVIALLKVLDLPQSNDIINNLKARMEALQQAQEAEAALKASAGIPFKQQAKNAMPSGEMEAVDNSQAAQRMGAMTQV